MALPLHVTLCEVGPRDGFQFETTFIPTDRKLAIITALADAGLPVIQVTSFVHPRWVPQMADAEAVCRRLPARDDVRFTGLALNTRGVERAHAAGLRYVDLSIATHDRHSLANANMPVAEAAAQAVEMVRRAQGCGMQAQLGLQTVFGYETPGDTPIGLVLDLVKRFTDLGVESLSLADSTGMANPVMIEDRVRAVQDVAGDVPLVLHLHDTRGLGLANVMAALRCGVTRFDTSLGGLGGCPFIPGATGNIATEDTVYLLDAVGVATGVDLAAVAAASQQMEQFLERPLPGKLYRLVNRVTSDE